MDLSGLIFVVLAVAWAGYLIPRALRQHDDLVPAEPVDTSSDTARVLKRTPAMMRVLLAETPPVDPVRKRADRVALKKSEQQHRAAVTRSRPVSRGAAVRRRRVLLLLTGLTALSAALAGLSYVGWWSLGATGALVVAWLVTCVLMARRARLAARAAARASRRTPADEGGDAQWAVPAVEASPLVEALVADVHEDAAAGPEAAPRATEPELDAAAGALWDPLPLTLPTYVGKPTARRTVRSIELTRTGLTSSGHDAADSKLARQAREAAEAAVGPISEAAAEALAAVEQARARRAAGA